VEGEFTGSFTVSPLGIDNPPEEPTANLTLEGDDRWKVVLRVAASQDFRKSTRLREFLLYVCRRALTGRISEIREQQVGLDVFGRRLGYNPADDNIVRVEARELRRRLDHYFDAEGAQEPIRIRIPKGGYAPVFEAAGSAPLVVPDPSDQKESSDAQPQSFGGKADGGAFWQSLSVISFSWRTIAWVVVVALLSFGLGIFMEVVLSGSASQRGPFPGFQSGVKGEAVAPASLWLSLFDPGHPITIVVSDASLVLVEDITRQLVSVADYSDGSYLVKLAKENPELGMIRTRPYTSLADAVLTAKLVQAAAAQHRAIVIRYARDLKMRDLEDENLILLGTAYSNPWIGQFNEQRNFILGVDESTRRLYFLDKLPQEKEQGRYYAGGESNRTNENYGLVTYLSSFQHTNKVLIIEGTNSEATEAAGDFITDPYYGAQLTRYLGSPGGTSSFPYFQLLLKVTTLLNNTPSELLVIAHRVNTNIQQAR